MEVGVQRHAPAAPYSRERPGTHCTGGWVGLRAGLDRCGKSRPTGIRSMDRPARSESLYLLSYPGPLKCHSCYVIKYYIYKTSSQNTTKFISLCCTICNTTTCFVLFFRSSSGCICLALRVIYPDDFCHQVVRLYLLSLESNAP